MKRFSAARARAINAIGYMKIRCGDHRFIYVWPVLVRGRVLVRSWNDKKRGWYRAFLEEPRGAIIVDDNEVAIRAVPVTSRALIDAASDAYAVKYTTKSNLKYVKGFRLASRRMNTLELVPHPS